MLQRGTIKSSADEPHGDHPGRLGFDSPGAEVLGGWGLTIMMRHYSSDMESMAMTPRVIHGGERGLS